MSIRTATFELTVGYEATAVTSASGYDGGGAKQVGYDQPDWYDNASITNRVTTWGKASGTLDAAGTATIDLTALTGPDGSTVTLATLVCGIIRITSTTGKLRIGNAAANAHLLDFGAANDTWTIRPTGPGLPFGDPVGTTGYTVDGTHKNVMVENTHGSESVTYEAFFAGRT